MNEKDVEKVRASSSESGYRERFASRDGTAAVDFPQSNTAWGRFVDSFKQNPNARVTTEAVDSEGRPIEDGSAYQPALAMKLKGRHLQMIAIGGSIGPFCTASQSCGL